MKRIQRLLQRAAKAPLYRKKFAGLKPRAVRDLRSFSATIPPTRLEELAAETLKNAASLSPRLCVGRGPRAIFQLEYDTQPALYLALDRADLRGYAQVLKHCWSLAGLRKGDRVAIFDYGTSPLSYLAASSFTPYLDRGAADLLGCLPVCNDGVANMSPRAVEILRYVRPRVLFIRHDCLHALAVEVERQALRLADYTQALVAAENESLLSDEERRGFEKRLGVPIYRLLRIDAAMFLAMECPRCRLLHCRRDAYFVETLAEGDGATENPLVVTNWFAGTSPTVRYLSQVRGSLQPSGCPRGPKDLRIAV
jgi:phenylacetate-coenzyme A ligase PaaK-like adenylate-forming protein